MRLLMVCAYICVTYKEAGGGEEKKSSFNVLSARQGIYRENTQVIGDTTDRFVPRKREQTSNEFAFRCELLFDRPSFFVQFVFVQLSAIIKLEQVYIYIYLFYSRDFSLPLPFPVYNSACRNYRSLGIPNCTRWLLFIFSALSVPERRREFSRGSQFFLILFSLGEKKRTDFGLRTRACSRGITGGGG